MNENILCLNIGELIVTGDDVVISTTLGSCVSVCLYSSSKKIVGMIHYALPCFLENSEEGDDLRYGDRAIPILIEEMVKATKEPVTGLKAKIVGGANCFIRNSKGGLDDIGERNIEMGKKILKQFRIEIVGEHTGGDVGRKVLYHGLEGRLQVASLTKLE
ncbi:hypothetical protein DOM21_16020 [Bacteriovorax stolpii]|uniref:chemotaxis protein CheD n=1 Tax=Bacteriovorax stolpii TaxID=960 RepID=UPI00115AD989|nr:chemotaxis protein CheD [Bacteriovorax stolpii]QDK42930.1 hypothetical protein DOM21_16020 [Bacteriovorax stolpii]